MEDGKSITEDEHTEFYRFVTGQYDKPRYTLQYKIDVPINLRALIYIPQYKPSSFVGFFRSIEGKFFLQIFSM